MKRWEDVEEYVRMGEGMGDVEETGRMWEEWEDVSEYGRVWESVTRCGRLWEDTGSGFCYDDGAGDIFALVLVPGVCAGTQSVEWWKWIT